jgi:transcriptional regulator with PAS, ATPase and Fis domain
MQCPRPYDIHELAQNSFLQRMEEAAAGTLATNAEGLIVWMDEKYGRLLGVNANEMVGRHILELLPTSRIPEVLETGKPIPLDLMKYSGEWRVVSRFPVLDGNGAVLGAFGFVLFTSPAKIAGIVKRYERDLQSERAQDANGQSFSQISDFLGRSEIAARLRAGAYRAAQATFPTVVVGPCGSGKQLVAEGIHAASARRLGKFVAVDLGSENVAQLLFEDQRVGGRPRPSSVQLADGGTLFLDRIDEMPLALQGRLLRELEHRPGTRVIASTRTELRELCGARTFLPELHWYLEGITLRVPGLRERIEDIDVLAEKCLEDARVQLRRRRLTFSSDAFSILRQHSWPGNVRQLRHVVIQAAFEVERAALTAANLQPFLTRSDSDWELSPKVTLSTAVEGTEQQQIALALARYRNNVSSAARSLGISRTTLYKKARALGLIRSRGIGDPGLH